MVAERWLFWHRRDLRLADNLGLAAAAAATPALTGVFVLDPAILGAADMAPARVWFLLESLQELQQLREGHWQLISGPAACQRGRRRRCAVRLHLEVITLEVQILQPGELARPGAR